MPGGKEGETPLLRITGPACATSGTCDFGGDGTSSVPHERKSATMFRGLDVDSLGLDRAYVNVSSGYGREAVYSYRRNANCDGCPFQRVGEVRKGWGWRVMRRRKKDDKKM